MWRNYWTVAVRALAKSKTYSIINIAGLAIGMAACIMILFISGMSRATISAADHGTPTSFRPGTTPEMAIRCSQMSAYVSRAIKGFS
jgi:hypothetical protein